MQRPLRELLVFEHVLDKNNVQRDDRKVSEWELQTLINPRKNRWMRTIRSQRRVLKDLREDQTIEPSQYRRYYLKAKGGSYRSIAHMRSQMALEGVEFKGGDE